MFLYQQKPHKLYQIDGGVDRFVSSLLYSGAPEVQNDPLHERDIGHGPIPHGVYWIGEPKDTLDHGPFVLPLIPVTPGTDMYGRSGFLIHGDNKEHPGAASHGCIITPRDIRELIAKSKKALIVVVSGVMV